ncbi:DUF2218 domain-containing protein [Streptomyces sp. ME02-6991-2B]|nr:DUF2218 domain-containing protein [Streptomyces sp. ME02-6991-2B]
MGVEHPQRAEGHVRTDQPARCPAQLQACAATMSRRPDTHAALAVGQAGPGMLTLRVEAVDQDALRRVQHLVGDRLQEIGGPDAPQVTWHGAEDSAPRPRHRTKLGITAVVVLVVAAHLGLGGLLLTSGPWRHWAVGAVVAVVVAKSVFLLLRRRRARRLSAGAPAPEGVPHGPGRRRRSRHAAHDRWRRST